MNHGLVTDSTGGTAAGMHGQGDVVVRTSEATRAAQRTGAIGVLSPTARRLRPPGWLNLRFVAGIMLVLISVIVGGRVLTAADTSDSVWAAATDLAAGTVLGDGDLRAVSVRLADSSGAYLLTSTDPIGRVLSSPIRAGELLPGAVLAERSTLVDIALPIASGFVPPSLHHGQLVDVYAFDATPTESVVAPQAGADASAGGPGTAGTDVVHVVVEAAVVQLITGRTDGALSIGASTVQVVISVQAEQAPDIFAAIAGRELALAVRSALDQPSQSGPVEPGRSQDSSTSTPAAPTD